MAGKEKFTDRGIKAITKAGRHSDGNGLYLRVKNTGGKSWSFMWKRDGRQRELGLGPYPSVSLKAARIRAAKVREAIAIGEDPRSAIRPPDEKTFLSAAKSCLEARKLDTKSPKTKRKWERTAYELCAELHRKEIKTVNRDDVYRILKPIWERTPETGRIVRSQLEIIFDHAKGRGWRDGENPAIWKGGLAQLLDPISRKNVRHHPAMPYEDVPAFISNLRLREAIAARALEFTILTASRTSEVLNSTADEFDLDKKVWSIPGNRMKSGRPHSVPLSGRAIGIFNEMRTYPQSEFVFPSVRGRPLSNMAMANLLKRMKIENATVHGFRSSFRDWAGDCTSYPREVAEAALAHSVGDIVERSYRRSDALEKRRGLMQLWADYCGGDSSKKVVRLHG